MGVSHMADRLAGGELLPRVHNQHAADSPALPMLAYCVRQVRADIEEYNIYSWPDFEQDVVGRDALEERRSRSSQVRGPGVVVRSWAPPKHPTCQREPAHSSFRATARPSYDRP